MLKTHGNFHRSTNKMVKKTQSMEGKNPNFLAFLHPDWFLPYILNQFKYTKNIFDRLGSYCLDTKDYIY